MFGVLVVVDMFRRRSRDLVVDRWGMLLEEDFYLVGKLLVVKNVDYCFVWEEVLSFL